jgi:putative hemolysin
MLEPPRSEPPRLIDLRAAIENPVTRRLYGLVELPLEKVLSLETINRLYAQSLSRYDRRNYFPTVLETLNIEYQVSDEDRAKIPAEGPVVVVANHPFGAIDGVILGDILTRARPDVRLLGNQLLAGIPEVRDWIIPVDAFGTGSAAVQHNIGPLKACVRWLRRRGVLATFPSGTVSHFQLRQGRVSDPPWSPNIAALVRRTGATVVPVFFEGRNSVTFQLAGLLHAGLRTALLPHELLKRSNSKVAVRIGRPISPEKSGRFADDATLIEYLRFKTYMLKRRESPVRPRFVPRPEVAATTTATALAAPIIDPVPTGVLAAEVARLPAETRLVEQNDYQLFIAEARQIPAVLREIGRLRELTFRAVSEGTGKSCDVDRFDEYYQHLFMWNRATSEVVGSYRIGRVDEILADPKLGPGALYTGSLFKFKAGFLERLGPALELGRSFIRPEYQRKPTALALLWRGIGELLVRQPRYKILFGPVSISRDYHSVSRRLMVEWLEKSRRDDTFAPLVKAKNPPRERLDADERRVLDPLIKDIDDLARLVTEIEDDNRGMPVLLKHYLRLNARLLSFNVDPDFGHCIDGLIIVDLRTTEPKILKRFMGEEGHAFYASVGS